MLAVALALGSTVAWGVSDFLGGLAGRRMQLLVVLGVSQAAGLILALALIPWVGGALPPEQALLLAAASGVADVLGLWALYRGLSEGAMGLVAPIAATGAGIPVLWGMAAGEPASLAILAGAALAIAGVALVSREPGEGESAAARRRGLVLGLLAALGFGAGFVLLDAAAESEAGWSVVSNRLGALTAVALVILWQRPKLRCRLRDIPGISGIGALDATAIALFAVASTHGAVGLVAALGSLYPIVTIVLARAVLAERLGTVRRLGAGIAVAGAMVLAVGAGGGTVTTADPADAQVTPAGDVAPSLKRRVELQDLASEPSR